jgi:[acyl-carrier-protein] S-malonyltransferase
MEAFEMAYAMVFPGQASQYTGMGQDIYENDQLSRELFDQGESLLGIPLKRLCFEGPLEELTETRHAQPAILLVSLMCQSYLERLGIKPAIVAGHSLGEYSALVAAGVIDPMRALELVALRGKLMFASGEKTPGTMAAIMGLEQEQVTTCCTEAAQGEVVQLANINCPGQLVISGSVAAVERAMTGCLAAGAKKAVGLTVSGAFHSELMAPAAEELAEALRESEFKDARVQVVPNVTARATVKGDLLRDLLIAQLTNPVLWSDSMLALRKLDQGPVLEVGPGKVLMGLMRRIDRGARVTPLGNLESMDAWALKAKAMAKEKHA